MIRPPYTPYSIDSSCSYNCRNLRNLRNLSKGLGVRLPPKKNPGAVTRVFDVVALSAKRGAVPKPDLT